MRSGRLVSISSRKHGDVKIPSESKRLYASSQGDIWRYRVVDEYEGETLSGPAELVSDRPLTLNEAVDFFLKAWNLFAVLTANFYEDGYPPDRVHAFFWASSPFYPELDTEVRRRVDAWLAE